MALNHSFKNLGKEQSVAARDLKRVLRSRRDGSFDALTIIKQEIHRVENTLKKVDEFYKKDLRWLDRFSDRIAVIGGSWRFICIFLLFLFGWMIVNSWLIVANPPDPFPFILLNLILSTVAALQAPVILMSQNRAAKRDQTRAELDLEKDLRDLHVDQSSHEILLELHRDMNAIKKKLGLK